MNILDQLAAHARERVEADRRRVPEEELRDQCAAIGPGNGEAFVQALEKPGLSFICEVKKASPSKGVIAEDFPYVEIARAYETAGADAVSCLTEPKWFLGSDDIFREIRKTVATPMLRKDFTVSAYQIRQARVMGADAVLLICAILGDRELEEDLALCRELGLAALTEAHDEEEIRRAVACGAGIIGVNNRNLKDFSVNVGNAARLRDKVPVGCLFVAESGVATPEDADRIRRSGADAALVGEALMRAGDKAAMLAALRRPL